MENDFFLKFYIMSQFLIKKIHKNNQGNNPKFKTNKTIYKKIRSWMTIVFKDVF